MRGKLKLIWVVFLLFNLTVFSQNKESFRLIISDQNGGLITSGIALLTDSKEKKVLEINLSEIGKGKSLTIETGTYILEIKSPGFKALSKTIEIHQGENKFEFQLELEAITATIEVEQSEREKRLDEAMGGYLSERELASLPENGEDIKEELKRRYGDDVMIRIDGDFEGSQVPSLSEISSIKVIRNTFDAEFHEVGRIIIDIKTNGVTSGFHGFGNFNFNTSQLNARNPFDLKRQPANSNDLIFSFSGPIVKKKTSFSLSAFSIGRTVTQNFIGQGYQGFVEPQKTGNRLSFTTFTIKHILSKNQMLNLKYQNSVLKFTNLGIGAFDLPERGSERVNNRHKFTLSASGTFSKKYVNDFRIEAALGSDKVTPNSLETTVLVLNAFNSGSSGQSGKNNQKEFAVADNLLFDVKKHSLKIGAELEFDTLSAVSENNVNGTFVFLTLDDFRNQRPRQFSQTVGSTRYNLNQFKAALYFQDYFKADKALQLSLGLRYEGQNRLRDYNNFSPRVGYVWSPEKSGKFIVRGGAGVFYDWLDTNTLSSILSNDGRQGRKIIIVNPSYPNPFDKTGLSQILLSNISKLADDLTAPYIFVAQNSFNYKFNKTITFEGIYTFRKGLHHFRSRNINAPVNGIRPDPNFGIIQLLESSGITSENSFELRVNGYYRGVNMYANYQSAKKISDFSTALSLPSDNYNLRLERGLSNLDQPHKLNISFNFNLLKTIDVSPSIRIESGFPYTITTGRDDNGDTVFNDRPFGISRNTERGEILKQVDLRLSSKLPLRYLGIFEKDDKKYLGLNVNVRNLFNTSNLTNYVGIQTSPFFGQPSSAQTPRSIQFGLSYRF